MINHHPKPKHFIKWPCSWFHHYYFYYLNMNKPSMIFFTLYGKLRGRGFVQLSSLSFLNLALPVEKDNVELKVIFSCQVFIRSAVIYFSRTILRKWDNKIKLFKEFQMRRTPKFGWRFQKCVKRAESQVAPT